MAVFKNPYLTVRELIEKLESVDPHRHLMVSDGYDSIFYKLLKDKVAVGEFTDDAGKVWVDIGIGGCRIEDEE